RSLGSQPLNAARVKVIAAATLDTANMWRLVIFITCLRLSATTTMIMASQPLAHLQPDNPCWSRPPTSDRAMMLFAALHESAVGTIDPPPIAPPGVCLLNCC